MLLKDKSFLLRIAVCFLAGAVLVLAFSPFSYGYLAFFCIAVLFYICKDLSATQALYCGLAFGYGQFGFGVSWVYVSLHTYGGMPFWMGAIAVVLFAGILAIFVAFATYTAAKLVDNGGLARLVMLAFTWVVFEWTKSWIFTGFAWLELGVTQTSTLLFSYAPIGGVYLLSLLVAVTAASLVALACADRKLIPSLLIALIIASGYLLDKIQWSNHSGRAITVGVVQGNVPINEKWQAAYRDGVIAKLRSLSLQLLSRQTASNMPLDLLVWPETALPIYHQQTDDDFWDSIVPNGLPLLTGIVDSPQYSETYNAAILYCDGKKQIYRKQHLVPFGEYLPMRFALNWLLDYLQLPMSDFTSGQQNRNLGCSETVKIGLSICYEDAFASEVRNAVGDATVLVNISEDAWFGDSLAPHQRLQMGQMRARELARPMVRSANSGPSAFIDERGRVIAQTPQFTALALAQSIQPMTGTTPYKKFGSWAVLLSLLVCVVVLAIKLRRR